MPVVFLITIVAVLVGIFFAATGRGGELAYEQADHAPLDLGPVTAPDVALLRPPTALWGYNMQVTDEALNQIARAVRERDITIAYLREQLASFERNGAYTEAGDAHAYQAAGLGPFPGAPETAGLPGVPETFELAQPVGTFDDRESADMLDDLLPWETPEALPPEDTFEAPQRAEAFEPAEALEASQPAEAFEAPQPAEPRPSAEPPAPAESQKRPRTPLVLRASPPHGSTQPSETLHEPDPREGTQPSATFAPDEAHGPQGDFNAHDWWAEQREAARQENTPGPAGTGGNQEDPGAAAEEQGW